MSRANLAGLIDGPARWRAGQPAVRLGERVVRTWSELAAVVARRAGGLRDQLGVRPGDAVGLFAANSPEYLELMLAVWHSGGVVVPISSRLHGKEAAALLGVSEARTCIVSAEVADGIGSHAPDGCRLLVVGETDERALIGAAAIEPVARELTDDAWIFFTSGTTGTPKGARLSHGNLVAMAAAYHADVDTIGPDDQLIHVAALSHASGLFALPFLARGATQVLPESGGFDTGELVGLLTAGERSTFFVPPTLLRRLTAARGAGAAAGRLGRVIVGAAPVRAGDLRDGIGVLGPCLWNGYGQGESPCTITAMGPAAMATALAAGDDELLASVGTARWGMRVRVIGDDGASRPAGEVGEVVADGPTVMSGYVNAPMATAETLRDGWLHTGDLGRFDAAGRLTLVDRVKDMVISGGYNVYPSEVERVLLADPAVQDAAVLGVPDAEWGERVVAFVVSAPGHRLDSAALDRRCLAEIARHKRPREYHAVPALPRNTAGKVLKRELRGVLTPEAAR
ncbi:MAG TPA: AMP-binding protein [Solirubrobacteraceae bacterium]|nr:AMP-binding protein [Solirubrobacteraceae bacterium]